MSQFSATPGSLGTGAGLLEVKVLDIILDLNHDRSEALGYWDSLGTIFYLRVDQIVGNPDLEKNWKDSDKVLTARPLYANSKYYPLKGEIVLILSATGKSVINRKKSTYYLPNVNVWNHPHHNAVPNPLAFEEAETKRDYINSKGGLVRHVTDGDTEIELGKYFKEKLNTKPLLPYEGDYILEGRHGNSIRFGSTVPTENIDSNNANDWSAEGEIGDPITIIRNGQSDELDSKGWEPTVEDINRDNTSIYLTSNQQITSLDVSFLKWESWQAEYEAPVDPLQALTSPPVEEVIEEEETVEETVFDPPPTNEDIVVDETEPSPPPPPITKDDEVADEEDELSMFDELIDSGDYDVDDFEEGELPAVSGQDVATTIEERSADGEVTPTTGGTDSSTGDSDWQSN